MNLHENIHRIKEVMGLNENISEYGITAYHRSDVDFDSFDMSKTESGFGMNRLGWGMYFSEQSDLNPKYGNILYEVKLVLPKDKKWLNDYITYDEVVELLGAISSDTDEINNLFNEFEKQRGKKLTHDVIRYFVTKYFDNNTYGDFGKDFALFLMNQGYVGRRVEFCENGKDTCLIVFDASIIHIMDKR